MTDHSSLPLSSPLLAASPSFLESLYESFSRDPTSVDSSWRYVFQLVDELMSQSMAERGAPAARQFLYAEWLRNRGHMVADLNPLSPQYASPAEEFDAWVGARAGTDIDVAALEKAYTGRMAVEVAHIDDADMVTWVEAALKRLGAALEPSRLRRAYHYLVQADEFERFLAKRYPGKKRFGAEGAEALVVLLDQILLQSAASGVDEVIIGGMHRGRLNLMANVLGKDLAALFAEFGGVHPFSDKGLTPADVPYHLGHSCVLNIGGKPLRVTLLPNPSHLEAVDPVVLGRTRAAQDQRLHEDRWKILGITLHTDAAVVGQGVVAESLQLSGLEGFTTLGTIHLIVNNQLGFTTEPDAGRTSRYCTGPWKAVDSLIMHVNGDDIEASISAAELAVSFRNQHRRDVVIDLIAYRRGGHNEIDEPRFTQPLLYEAIDRHTALRRRLESELRDSGVLSEQDCNAVSAAYRQSLQDGYRRAGTYLPASNGFPAGLWEPYCEFSMDAARAEPDTSIGVDDLSDLLKKIAHIPSHVTVGAKLSRLVEERKSGRNGIVWAVAEALAFGSLLTAGVSVRLAGQDIVRGAFSHRHFALTDVLTGEKHITLNRLASDQAPFTVIDSPLSEYAVLGFEYGYSLHDPKSLVIWEAQFGDFANGAQVIIDQFILSGEDKWRQPSGLVMLLPHGLEGQGPEHSSARIERYLQMACGDNMMLVNPSTPANYFHILRRQALGYIRKPLIVLAPKTLLRLPAAVSQVEDFGPGSAFSPILCSISEVEPNRILLCSGKIYYELERERQKRGAQDVMIVRIEQLYPMPSDALAALICQYPSAKLLWVQEEPENMGAWSWYDRKLEDLARAVGHRAPRVSYCGRPQSCSPAGSFHTDHEAHQVEIVASAFTA